MRIELDNEMADTPVSSISKEGISITPLARGRNPYRGQIMGMDRFRFAQAVGGSMREFETKK